MSETPDKPTWTVPKNGAWLITETRRLPDGTVEKAEIVVGPNPFYRETENGIVTNEDAKD